MTSSAAGLPPTIARATITRAAVVRAAVVRAAVVPAAPAPSGTGRHRAPEVPGVIRIAMPDDLMRTGRHAETEWSRGLHDPRRDEVDSLAWLGFRPARH